MRPASDPPLVPPDAVRVNVTMPVTRIGFGIFSFDPVEQMIGAPLTEILSSLMAGPVTRRPSATGAAVEVYPLALPEGEGATIPLAQFGEIGFANERGVLVLTVPWSMAAWLRGGPSAKHGGRRPRHQNSRLHAASGSDAVMAPGQPAAL